MVKLPLLSTENHSAHLLGFLSHFRLQLWPSSFESIILPEAASFIAAE